MCEVKYTSPVTPNRKKKLEKVQNMHKYISLVQENQAKNAIKLIVHLLICLGRDFTLARGAVYD